MGMFFAVVTLDVDTGSMVLRDVQAGSVTCPQLCSQECWEGGSMSQRPDSLNHLTEEPYKTMVWPNSWCIL